MKKKHTKEEISKTRIIFIIVLIILLFSIIITRLYFMQFTNVKASIKELEDLSTKTVYGNVMPRGIIYDRNHNVIVDNVGIYVISYKKESKTTIKDEIDIAYLLSDNIELDFSDLKIRNLKEFWIANNLKKADKKITDKEYELYQRRKLKASELENLKIDRITDEELSKYDDRDKKTAYIYYLMNNGYSYDEKIIKEEASSIEYSFINQNKENLKGIDVYTSWKRVYPYGDTLRQILGVVSTSKQGIPKDKKLEYLKKGYQLNDRVGLSYLELEYEDYLKGTKDIYEIKNGKKKLIQKGSKGNDLVLSIDINLQKEVEQILEEEVLNTKKEHNTEFYDHTSTVITDPNTGEILAMASKRAVKYNDGYKIEDYTTNLLTGSDTPGSIVKGASMIVGYRTGVLKIGDVLQDKCIKFKSTKEKCSWSRSLGALNDITALRLSSNSYQFQLAMKVAGIKYYYNMPVKIDSSPIDTYRSTFTELGLGAKSEIDLPNETSGYKGKESNIGLLLNFSIGQYDTYTALQLSSYINSIINNGNRLKLNLVSEINNNDKQIKKYEKTIINKVDVDEMYFNRVKEGFKSVMEGSLGRNYMGASPNPAGKTGTSESFYDSDLDGKVDSETYTKSFIGFAPFDNPVMSIISISPHAGRKTSKSTYTSNVNKRIVSRICNKFFEIYK